MKKILVSAGHGGAATGAVSRDGRYKEAELALSLRSRVATLLRARGLAVSEDGGDAENLPLTVALSLARQLPQAVKPLSDMLPDFSQSNHADQCFCHAESVGKVFQRFAVLTPLANFFHLLGGQLGCVHPFTACARGRHSIDVLLAFALTAALYLLRHILIVGAETQMAGITAWRVVTAMQNEKLAGVIPVVNQVSNPRGGHAQSADEELTVTAFKSSSGPFPARIRRRLTNFRVKTSDVLLAQGREGRVLDRHFNLLCRLVCSEPDEMLAASRPARFYFTT